jgi:two-component system NtrC family sensor kinase
VRNRLAARVGLALCAGAAAILAAAGAWNLRLQRAHLTRLVGASADRIAETIRSSTRDGMLRNDSDGVHRIIQNIGAQQGISRVRVFNKEGRIRTSTDPGEVGALVDKGAEECYACHQRDRPMDRLDRADRVRLFRAESGERILGIIAPIHNEPQCVTACHAHSPSQRVLGVLDVQLSMASVDEALRASERQLLAALVVTVAAVLALAGLLLWRMVLRPVDRLTRAMSRVASGDLETRVDVTSRDEIGSMAASWNAMAEEVGRARRALQDWNETLERRVEEKTVELKRAHERMLLVERMASLGKLAAVVAHEINNPLAGIRTYARVLRRRFAGTADAETDGILQMVDSESGRCGDIVRNLLSFSRSTPAHFADEDLEPVLDRCGRLLRHQAELLGVTLDVQAAAGLPRVRCDAAQVQQMVLALAMNALESTPGGGRVTLATRADEAVPGVVIEVSDTGCGIREEDLSRIFEPFYTTKEAGKGVGLGLAVVYGIVTRHHGRIDVRSTVGTGTTFSVHLPLEQPEEAP